jgi:hypothetical protein
MIVLFSFETSDTYSFHKFKGLSGCREIFIQAVVILLNSINQSGIIIHSLCFYIQKEINL